MNLEMAYRANPNASQLFKMAASGKFFFVGWRFALKLLFHFQLNFAVHNQ